ncbi:sensor histidine kinase [Ammoniphilus sp. CFH 90114]|uniref:ATP-binding protein n=1 Tax=Ammoniphilus sp. CFH 90114 TaxID=2493665 RepID=UPI00100EEBF7|nr:sensor histidine kinase [Ammoniphilus sp. CFH 90114]RXT13718.1 sensor histidine kinase [Ammoniphilus sp. CFH 90114]
MRNLIKLKLQHRITLLNVFLVLLIVVLTSALFFYATSHSIEQQVGKRALHLAQYVATMPEIHEAFKTSEPWIAIQPTVERIRLETDAEFIVVGNEHGVRYSHPLPERIGKEMVGGDNERALVYGESYISKAIGSLGPSLRGKVPIKDDSGKIIGVVSVGFLLEDIEDTIEFLGWRILGIAVLGILIGVLGSVYLARSIKNSMFGLEPEEISSLYKERDAVIQSVREGIIVVNRKGQVSMANQAAYDILSLPNEDLIGKPVLEVIPHSTILEVLHTGEEQLDRQMIVRGNVIIANRLPVKSGDKVIGVVSSFRLKSEIDQLTEELSQVTRYAEALRAQTHEFNNLLYTLSGLLQLESYDQALELIHKETADHQDIVHFIMSKLQDPWLGGIMLGFYNRAKELKVQFLLDRESSLKKLPHHIDSSAIVSIIGNLITNAFESVEKNPEDNRLVRLFVTDIGDDLLFEIEDSGPGIHDEWLTLIFKRGFSTKEGENRGIGLARVKELVDELDGTIAIERGDIGGALFIIAIPKERSEMYE